VNRSEIPGAGACRENIVDDDEDDEEEEHAVDEVDDDDVEEDGFGIKACTTDCDAKLLDAALVADVDEDVGPADCNNIEAENEGFEIDFVSTDGIFVD
jgi:hypothetical protein